MPVTVTVERRRPKPMSDFDRRLHYAVQRYAEGYDILLVALRLETEDMICTPAQRRRAHKKARRNGEELPDTQSRGKGVPTIRQVKGGGISGFKDAAYDVLKGWYPPKKKEAEDAPDLVPSDSERSDNDA